MKFRNYFVCRKCGIVRYHSSDDVKETTDRCIECNLIDCIYLNSIDMANFSK